MKSQRDCLASFVQYNGLPSDVSKITLAKHGIFYNSDIGALQCSRCNTPLQSVNAAVLALHQQCQEDSSLPNVKPEDDRKAILSKACGHHTQNTSEPMDYQLSSLPSTTLPMELGNLEQSASNQQSASLSASKYGYTPQASSNRPTQVKKSLVDPHMLFSVNKNIVRVTDVQMKNLDVRLKTFENVWPADHPVPAEELAAAGFFYFGQNDRVKCAFCQKKIKNWELGDRAMTEHQRISPDCPFVKSYKPASPTSSMSQQSSPSTSTAQPRQQSSNKETASIFLPIGQLPEIPKRIPTTKSSILPSKGLKVDLYPENGTLIDQAIYIIQNNGTFYEIQMLCNTMGLLEDQTVLRRHVPMQDDKDYFIQILNSKSNELSLAQLINATEGLNLTVIHSKLIQLQRDQVHQRASQFTSTVQGTPSAEAGYPQYSNYDTRVDTFMNSKWGESEDKYTFAAAGFYYYGVRDYVRCFWCKGGLCDWQPSEDPFREHARWFPQCKFLIEQKGTSFIEHVQSTLTSIKSPVLTETPGDVVDDSSELSSLESNDDLVNQYTEMGFTKSCVIKALGQLGDRQNIDSELLVNTICMIQDELNANLASQAAKENKSASTGGGKVGDTQASRDSGISSASAENSVANAPSGSEKIPFGPGRVRKKRKSKVQGKPGKKNSGQNNGQNAAQNKSKVTTNVETTPTKKKTSLPSEIECKVCMDAIADAVITPCGHLCCCLKCLKPLKTCPICRGFIRGHVKAILS